MEKERAHCHFLGTDSTICLVIPAHVQEKKGKEKRYLIFFKQYLNGEYKKLLPTQEEANKNANTNTDP